MIIISLLIQESGCIRAFEGDYPDEMKWVSIDSLKQEIYKEINKCIQWKKEQKNEVHIKRFEDFIDCYYNILSSLDEG